MFNPVTWFGYQLLRRTPTALFLASTFVSFLDFLTLFACAQRDGVLWMKDGVGLFQNYGLISTLVCNCFLLSLAKRYYETVCLISSSKGIRIAAPVNQEISTLAAMVRLQKPHRGTLYFWAFVGAAFWCANAGIHLFGDSRGHWGPVFDSAEHPASFLAGRLHNLLTWVLILPVFGHVMIWTSLQLRRAVAVGLREDALEYDVLNPDERGGFGFVNTAYSLFNFAAALVYVEITAHSGTFDRMNPEHVIGYVGATLLFLTGNDIVLGGILRDIARLRTAALDKLKQRVYRDDRLSFDILRYCYERRVNVMGIIDVLTKVGTVAASASLKLIPWIGKAFT